MTKTYTITAGRYPASIEGVNRGYLVFAVTSAGRIPVAKIEDDGTSASIDAAYTAASSVAASIKAGRYVGRYNGFARHINGRTLTCAAI